MRNAGSRGSLLANARLVDTAATEPPLAAFHPCRVAHTGMRRHDAGAILHSLGEKVTSIDPRGSPVLRGWQDGFRTNPS
jgi:hypothetical protein